MLNWTATKDEVLVIRDIAERGLKIHGGPLSSVMMDIEATHCNGCPLDLTGLLNAGDADFAHDICGIRDHLSRFTGELQGGFVPRYAKVQVVQ